MSSDDDGGYVHDPARFDEDGEETVDEDWLEEPAHPATADREFDRRGWLLVGVIVFAFVVAPLSILLYPPGADGYRFALLVVPLAPAILLAATAVWATTRP